MQVFATGATQASVPAQGPPRRAGGVPLRGKAPKATQGGFREWDNRGMHPKVLLDACAELVRLTLTFEHPADAVVSRFFRDNRGLGPRERATLAETVYTVLRKKLLFDHMAPSGSGPKERRLAILGFYGPRDFLKSAH